MNGHTSICDRRPANHELGELANDVLVKYILDLDDRGFGPQLACVEDMANYLLEIRGAQRIGKLWAHRFVQRRPELKTRFNCVYDFQRANLDVKLLTPTRTPLLSTDTNFWTSQTPHNPTDALLQANLVKNCIASHQESSQTPILKIVVAFAKGTELLVHENTYLAAGVRTFRKANEALGKRWEAKKRIFFKRRPLQ